jgi:hypothetical protein
VHPRDVDPRDARERFHPSAGQVISQLHDLAGHGPGQAAELLCLDRPSHTPADVFGVTAKGTVTVEALVLDLELVGRHRQDAGNVRQHRRRVGGVGQGGEQRFSAERGIAVSAAADGELGQLAEGKVAGRPGDELVSAEQEGQEARAAGGEVLSQKCHTVVNMQCGICR